MRLRVVVVGFGRMAYGYAADELMARHYRFTTHAQVLAQHSAFDVRAVIDPDDAALASAHGAFESAATAKHPAGLGDVAHEIDVAVLATPPHMRLSILDHFPRLRAVLVEKPLGVDHQSGEAFLRYCDERNILVQVNLWRRADTRLRALAGGELEELIGPRRFATAVYGNGLLNNGTHLVDMARMFFGEVGSVQRIGNREAWEEGPISGDDNPAFSLSFSDLTVVFQPVQFARYRENGLDVWGDDGRLSILNEGLVIQHFRRASNRATTGEYEISADSPRLLETTVGDALYAMYDNLAGAVLKGDGLWSPGSSALETSRVVEAIRKAPDDGRRQAV